MTAHPLPVQMMGETEAYTSGEYSKHYEALHELGKGAFGCVRLSRSRKDHSESVTKFICKSLVMCESWISSASRGGRMVPIEIEILEKIKHPNVIALIDVFENPSYYCLVMERRPKAIDLFEFLENKPLLDEPLICHIFRQVVCAVDYLHQKGFVHRDIKDENVIIDENFHCELIDFGSAAEHGDGILFDTFCGTLQYASPEVLVGHSYSGPELDMWLLGILLYTLTFRAIPFNTQEQIKRCELELPWNCKEGPRQLIQWLLDGNAHRRATMSDIKQHWWLGQKVQIESYTWHDVLSGRCPPPPTGCAADLECEQTLLTTTVADLEVASSPKIKGT